MGHYSIRLHGALMHYILAHHFYCDFCQMKKYRRHKSHGSGMLEEAGVYT